MRRGIVVSCLLLIALGAGVGPAPAQALELEVTPFVGYRSDGYEAQQDVVCAAIFESCTLESASDDGTAVGLVVGAGLWPGWQVELLASRQKADLDARVELVPLPSGTPVAVEAFTETVDREVGHLQVGLARTWGQGTVRPFVGAAAGISRIEIDAVEPDPRSFALYAVQDSSEDAFSASLGGGVKVDLARHVGLRLEGRAWWVDLGEDAGGDFTQLDAAAGLAFHW